MKKFRLTSIALFLMTSIFYFGCEPQADLPKPETSILPERFGVDIPNSLSSEYSLSNGRVAIDTLKGNDIYQHLNLFINVGDGAAEIVGDIIRSIRIYEINKPMSLSFEGDEDGRTKNLVVKENPSFDGENWEFMLTITDASSESELDGGKGLQIFWNRYPIKGIAILKPYNINREENFEAGEAMFRIDYSEAGEHGYEGHMIVSIANLPIVDPLDDPYSMNTLKMFAGKEGDIIDVYGNSNHPNATFFAGNSGFNWAFVASGSESKDIGVAEVGLPPSNLDEPSRETLLDYYSIKNVFTREINDVWPNIDQSSVDAYLFNTGAPGYFSDNGFVSGGESPGEEYNDLEFRLSLISPYNPKEISNLNIEFK
ncbi:MAG: hypothetical protein KAQ79_06880 [Cyclobacteriaceae bacterium]|nr:hypothetical protein [Cyclobacteriaceae bacterium]